MLEGGPVVLGQHVRADLDHIVRSHPENLRVEGSVMDRTHRHAVRNDRLPAVSVLLDVSCVQQRTVPEPTKCALGVVSEEHPIPERALMEPLEDQPLRVPARRIKRREGREPLVPAIPHGLVQGNDELLMLRLLSNEPHWKVRAVDAWCDANKPDERPIKFHGPPQRDVVMVERIAAPPLVSRIAVGAGIVAIRPEIGP
jgi:hypothetical protein